LSLLILNTRWSDLCYDTYTLSLLILNTRWCDYMLWVYDTYIL
jgi:hypothetical protein